MNATEEQIKKELLKKLEYAIALTFTQNADYSLQVKNLAIAYGILNGTIIQVSNN